MSAYSDAVMALSPEAYLRLGESSGTTAVDISGNGHDGTYHGTPTLGVAGAAGDSDTAVEFGGSGDYLTVPVPLHTLGASALTVMFFLLVPTFADDNGAAFVYGTDWYNDSIFCLPNCNVGAYSGTFAKGISNSSPFSQQTLNGTTRPSAGDWHHIIVTTDASSGGTTKLFIDCTEVGTPASGLADAWHRTDKDFYFAHNGTDGVDLACSLDEIAVITRVINSTEIDSVCQALSNPSFIGVWGGA